MEKYVFKAWDERYPLIFEQEKALVQKQLDCKIEHVGSTAVRGLGGKGIVDISVGVDSEDLSLYIPHMESCGYEFREAASVRHRLFFRKDVTNAQRIHLHLVRYLSMDWDEMIRFRNLLRENSQLKRKYAELKKHAVAKAGGDGSIYKFIKTPFILDALENTRREENSERQDLG